MKEHTMAKRFGWCSVGVLLVLTFGCKSKTDGASGDGDGDGDGDAAVDIEPTSGERLKLQKWSGGGIDWVENVYDSELKFTCNFHTGTDGNWYCFPGYVAN